MSIALQNAVQQDQLPVCVQQPLSYLLGQEGLQLWYVTYLISSPSLVVGQMSMEIGGSSLFTPW